MKRAKYMFLVLPIAYILIAIGKAVSFLDVNNNILLGLSLTSLLLSIGDSISIISSYRIVQNSLEYSLSWLSRRLGERIEENTVDTIHYDVYNIKAGIDNIKSVKKESIHPIEYSKRKAVVFFQHVPIVFFGLAILCFVIIPFVKKDITNNSAPQYLTIVAFAVMCLNIYLDEETTELNWTVNFLNGDKLILVNSACPGILVEYFNHMQHYMSSQKLEEEMKQLQKTADKVKETVENNKK